MMILGLDRKVERRNRLVPTISSGLNASAPQQFRAYALAAGEFVRMGRVSSGRSTTR